MTTTKIVSDTHYLVIDCEFTEQGLVRELVLLLYKNNQLVRALEVFISASGEKEVKYSPQQVNYHLADASHLNYCINSFLNSCRAYAPIKELKIVGMSLEHDMKSILNTTNQRSLLNSITQKTQLEICGRGTLEEKAKGYHITQMQITHILNKLVTPEHSGEYRYHTALYDAVVTAYVYWRVMGEIGMMGVHNRFKKCTHTYMERYYKDISKDTKAKKRDVKKKAEKKLPKVTSEASPKISKNFPEIRYRVQKNISNVFDIVAREIFYQQISRLRYEPTLKRISIIKKEIMEQIYPVKCQVATYDTKNLLTDPYNPSLVRAGILLVKRQISLEDFIDFAIYMQQYNLPSHQGTYYKVWNQKKELFVRCLQEETAKKLLAKRPYCTIEQFLRKEIIECECVIMQ